MICAPRYRTANGRPYNNFTNYDAIICKKARNILLDFKSCANYNIVMLHSTLEVVELTNNLTENKFKILSGSALKMLAIITMAIDHSAAMLYPVIDAMRIPFSLGGKMITLYWIMRKIGRLAFPIFCFLITEGYQHTRNKMRYGLRVLIFAIISEIPFNLLFSNNLFDSNGQNVFFTLFLGLLMIHVYNSQCKQLIKFLAMVAVGVIATYLKADYGLNGVLLVFIIYLFRNTPSVQALLAYPLLSGGVAAWVAFIPINLYNGNRGFIKSPMLKYAFYAFYPVHILILHLIKHLL